MNRDSGTPTVRDEDQRLLTLTPQTQIWSNSPISYVTTGTNLGDSSPVSPGACYSTIHSTGSRRYAILRYLQFSIEFQQCAD